MPQPLLVTQWAVCGIAAAAARFVPVPLLDDVVRQRARQAAVVQTLRAHGRTYPSDALRPLWTGDADGRGGGLRRRLRSVSTRLLLFPVRKYTAVFGAVRGVPDDVMRVVLLARTVDRRLTDGELADVDRLPDESRALRRAVDQAVEGLDLRLLRAALTDGLSGSRGLSTSAVALARRRLARDEPVEALEPDAVVADGAERVTQVLRRPEVRELLERFDARLDALLGDRP